MIYFNSPLVTGNEKLYIGQSIDSKKICGNGIFTKKCTKWLEANTKSKKVFLTTSGTHALELAAILADIKPGDEIIMPSYTFASTANAFVLRGARIRYVDIDPGTMNIDETRIEEAISSKTKVIVPVHYAGVGCEMDTIMKIAKKYNLLVIEDAAQGVMATYNGKALGSIGHIGCYSFHETKNYTSGEGGAILINDERFIERAEIVREKGTDRTKFLKGLIDKYTWVDIGSSYSPSDINAAFLYAHLKIALRVNKKRLFLWHRYYQNLKNLSKARLLELPIIPRRCRHNAHTFFIKLFDIEQRNKMIEFLKLRGIEATFHYIPLHLSLAGEKFGEFVGKDIYTTRESSRILRLPMYYDLKEKEVDYITDQIKSFFKEIKLKGIFR